MFTTTCNAHKIVNHILQHYFAIIMYLTTIHGNSWNCPILSSLSQLLPDTLSDLIGDTRTALLRGSLWWEADKEEDCNSDQAEHCSFDLYCFVPTQSATRVLSSYSNRSSRLTVRRTIDSRVTGIGNSINTFFVFVLFHIVPMINHPG